MINVGNLTQRRIVSILNHLIRFSGLVILTITSMGAIMPRFLITALFAALILVAASSNSHAQSAEPTVLGGDVNLDGVVNFFDIPPFIRVLQSGVYQAEADVNFDGFVNFLDIPALLPFFVGQ